MAGKTIVFMEKKMATAKKVTKVDGGSNTAQRSTSVITPEAKGKAKKLRIFAVISWVLALAAEAGAIFVLLTNNEQIRKNFFIWLIVLIVVDLAFVITGSLLWKKANRFDPASKNDKVKFFLQNQLGVIIAFIAFLPLIILVFTNKDISGKQKKIIGAIGIAALLIAGIFGIDFNPPSLEDYIAQTEVVQELTGGNNVYWTKSGNRYHIYSDCQHINTSRTDEIFEGTVANARELKNITELCKTCENKARRAIDTGENN